MKFVRAGGPGGSQGFRSPRDRAREGPGDGWRRLFDKRDVDEAPDEVPSARVAEVSRRGLALRVDGGARSDISSSAPWTVATSSAKSKVKDGGPVDKIACRRSRLGLEPGFWSAVNAVV